MIPITEDRQLASFDQPLRLLTDCHRRIEKFLQVLIDISDAAEGGELSPRAAEEMSAALRYFRAGAPMHNSDEEISLFPRLAASSANAAAVIGRLEADHRVMEPLHEKVDCLCQSWLERGRIDSEGRTYLLGLLRGMQASYSGHIQTEDQMLFPLAASSLATGDLQNIGREMASRRGVDFDHLPPVSRCAQRRSGAA